MVAVRTLCCLQCSASFTTNTSQKKYCNTRCRWLYNRDKHRGATLRWQKANPGKKNAHLAKRFASKRHRTPKWLSKEQLKQIERFYVEAKEITNKTGIQHEVDHITPLQGKTVSGLHVPWNLRVISAQENQRKGNR